MMSVIVLDKDILGRFNANRLHLAFSFWLERAHFKIGKDWRREGPLPVQSVEFICPIQVCREFWIKAIVVCDSGKARRPLENAE